MEPGRIRIHCMASGPLDVNCYIIGSEGGEVLVIDPGGPGVARYLIKTGLKPMAAIDTHGHFDHVGGNRLLKETFPSMKLMIHRDGAGFLAAAGEHAGYWGMPFEDSPEPDRLLINGDTVAVEGVSFRIIHTPGHSPGGISIHLPGHVFTGDALFRGSIGRTDLPGGDHALLLESIRQKLLSLPDDTVVHPGHGPETTIGMEKDSNPFLQ